MITKQFRVNYRIDKGPALVMLNPEVDNQVWNRVRGNLSTEYVIILRYLSRFFRDEP